MQNVSVYTDVFYLVSLVQMSTTSEGARAVALCL